MYQLRVFTPRHSAQIVFGGVPMREPDNWESLLCEVGRKV